MAKSHHVAAGKLRIRFEIERHNGATTSRGQTDDSDENWIKRGDAWGGLMPLRGTEAENARKLMASATHTLTLRRNPGVDVTPADRVRVAGTTRILHLGSVLDIGERGHKLECVAAETVAPWTPAVLQPAIWLDARTLNLADAAAVATWSDRSGNSNDFTQGNASKRPQLSLAGLGVDRPAVVFDGGDSLAAAAAVLSGSAGAVAAVVSPSTVAQSALLSSADAAAADRFVALGYQNVSGQNRLQAEQQDADTADDITGDTNLALSAAVVLLWSSDGVETALRVNGAAEAPTVNSGANGGDWWADITGATNQVLGGLITSGGESRLASAKVAELVAVDAATELADLEKLEAYLLGRWRIG